MAQIADIIKYEGDNTTFIWKHPCEDFNSLTQLIVHETQEAIFFMNGQALDLFGPGRYTLETQNIPYLGKMLNRPTDDKTPFHCEVYFINRAEQMSIKWGTDSKVQYIDPVFNFPVSIGASGDMNLRVEDSRKLLLKLVGTEAFLTQAKLILFFRVFLMTYVKSYIAQVIKEKSINIFEIDTALPEFSFAIKELLKDHFADYGIALEQFFVTTVVPARYGMANDKDWKIEWKNTGHIYHKADAEDAQTDYIKFSDEGNLFEENLKENLEFCWECTDDSLSDKDRLMLCGCDFSGAVSDIDKIIDKGNELVDFEIKSSTIDEYIENLKAEIDESKFVLKNELKDLVKDAVIDLLKN